MDRSTWIETGRRLVDERLEALLPPAHEEPADLHAAMLHLVFPGGKRFRPLFALAGAEAAGAPAERGLPMAVAVELVHTYSLIHDDLPCMDDDRERRGRPTVHVAFGEALAVLAGDALLAAAFEALVSADAEPALVLGCVADLARAAGSRRLVAGQAEDLVFPATVREATRVEEVHRRKTGALFEAAVVGGARLADAEPATLRALGRFGERVGVAFQIADDLLDGSRSETCSLVRVLGRDAARSRAETLLDEALKTLEPLGAAAEALRGLARRAVWRRA